MAVNEENIRLIFGLKLRQMRQQKKLSLVELAEQAGMSVSYLNEIEKGKKYPKTDKIAALADALNVPYDRLVSLKLTKNLAPVAQIINSNIMQEIPLELFGIETTKLMDLVAGAPTKVSAFISTLIEIARNYNMSEEHFYFASLRSYQQMHECYFDELEQAVVDFMEKYSIKEKRHLHSDYLRELLVNDFNYIIDETELNAYPELGNIRSVYIKDSNKLLINSELADNQKAFLYGKELGYQFLELGGERAYATPWPKATSFDQVLNNMKASYFSGALLIHREALVEDMKAFFAMKKWNGEKLLAIMNKYNSSPEMFVHRLINLVPKHFGLNNLFFIRFNHLRGEDEFRLTKELHLSQLHSPHSNAMLEHYCRRWVSLNIFEEIENQTQEDTYSGPVIDAQRSNYIDSGNEYFCVTLGRKSKRNPDFRLSVTLGFLINNDFKKKVGFWDDEDVPTRLVNETCERCGLEDCLERAAEPKVLKKEKQREKVETAMAELIDKEKAGATVS